MSQKENDQRKGILADVEDERLEFTKELGLDEKIEGIDKVVAGILAIHLRTATSEEQLHLAQVIVCHNSHKEAAQYVAVKYKLNLVTSYMLPVTEIFVTSMDSVNDLLISRFHNMKTTKIV